MAIPCMRGSQSGGASSQIIYTNPFTGAYSVNLNIGSTYNFDVEVQGITGYQMNSQVFIPDFGGWVHTQLRHVSCRPSYLQHPRLHPHHQSPIPTYEINNGGFSASGQNSSRAHGAPTSGPWSAHSGGKVWATNLGGNYNNDEYSYLTYNGTFDLTGRRGITILWWQWLQTYDDFDYAVVQASNNGGSGWADAFLWLVLMGNHDQRGYVYGDYDLSWKDHSFNLDLNWAVNNFKVRFKFKSDWHLSGTDVPGWYIDDLKIITCEPVAGGLVGGYVTDANNNAPLNNVSVQHLPSGQFGTKHSHPERSKRCGWPVLRLVSGPGGASLTASKDLLRYHIVWHNHHPQYPQPPGYSLAAQLRYRAFPGSAQQIRQPQQRCHLHSDPDQHRFSARRTVNQPGHPAAGAAVAANHFPVQDSPCFVGPPAFRSRSPFPSRPSRPPARSAPLPLCAHIGSAFYTGLCRPACKKLP